MNTRRIFQAISFLAALLSSTELAAQGSQTVLGGGCENQRPATITGPLTIGSTMIVESPCSAGAGSTALLFFGPARPDSQWIPLRLQTGINHVEVCEVGILPIFSVDLSRHGSTFAIRIPNIPALQGLSIATQSACNDCGFAGCFLTLSKIVEITIG